MKKTLQLSIFGIALLLTSCISEDNTPVQIPPFEGSTITLNENGGDPTQANQFWVELGTGKISKNNRESWDLGFYSGEEFRVVLNSSLMMSVGAIENATNLKEVTENSVSSLKNLVQVANFQDNAKYIDNPDGNIKNQTTAIAEIKINDSENKVYLLNLGYKTYTGSTSPGSVYTMGDARGWKKIKITRHQQGYKLQYADLNDTEITEFFIAKDSNYNFKHFSFASGTTVDIQPQKHQWDIGFTVFTNLTNAGTFYTSYVFPDFVITNILGNVSAYEVVAPIGQGDIAYTNFKKEDIDASKFSTNDQRSIGANWRTTTGANGAEVYSNKFYIIKNSEGFFFKLKFLRMKDDNGNRGYPQFEYKAL